MIRTFMPGFTLAQLSTMSATAIAACLGMRGVELTGPPIRRQLKVQGFNGGLASQILNFNAANAKSLAGRLNGTFFLRFFDLVVIQTQERLQDCAGVLAQECRTLNIRG